MMGKPVIEGTRITVELILTRLAEGRSVDDIVAEYGVAITDLASGIRRNVIAAIEKMTGLEVTEVNIEVDLMARYAARLSEIK